MKNLYFLDTSYILALEGEESVMMSLFLDFLMKDIIKNPELLIPYTEKMTTEIDDLLTDVIVKGE